MEYLLDTNAYALFFQAPKPAELAALERILHRDGVVSFLLPEIVSMEIHSVLGKYRRGGNKIQHAACDRHIVFHPEPIPCANICYFPARRRMPAKVYQSIRKVMRDVEAGRGDLRAKIIPTEIQHFHVARQLLDQYADQFSFGSHDALVAATARLMLDNGSDVSLVTSDKGLKAVCVARNIPVFDPLRVRGEST